MLRRSSAALLASLPLLSLTAHAGAEPATAATTNTPRAAELRRDPQGSKGISPFFEALKRGDNALAARDFEAAIVAYRDAVAKDGENPLGQYRLGEAQILKGELHEAEVAFSTGLRLVASGSPSLKAKLLFALADVRERQKAYDEASVQWTEYEAFTTGQKAARGFSTSATERKRALEAWKKLSADSAPVKARIDKGLKAADEAVKKSSQ